MKEYLFYDQKNGVFGVFSERLRYFTEQKDTVVNTIYIARVLKRLPELNAYFIEYEKSKIGFLRSNKILKLGTAYVVEGKTDGTKTKRPRFRLGYTYLFYPYLYDDNRQNSEEIKLKELNNSYSDKQKKIFREKLLQKIFLIRAQSTFLPIPRKILQKDKRLEKLMHEFQLKNIKTNSSAIKKNYADIFQVEFDENYDYQYDENLSKDLIKRQSRKISLEHGAEIVIDTTEAITVVDVNSSQSVQTIEEINREAMEEILLQIVVRPIYGILVVDFINDEGDSFVSWVEEKVRSTHITFHGKTNLNLFEFTISR